MTNEELFENNKNLAYKITQSYRINYSDEYEDIVQVALFGLWKAVLSFDNKKRNRFTTWAYPIISNEINFYLRKLRKHQKQPIISIYSPIPSLENDVELFEILEDPNSNVEQFVEEHIDEQAIHKIEQEVLEQLSPRDREIYNLLKQDLTQTKVGQIIGLTQASIGRIRKKIYQKIKERAKEEEII